MTDDPSYRLFILEKFKGVEESLERIEKHLEKQNSAVAKLQEESNKRAIVVEDFRHLEKDFECVKEKVEKIDKDLLEVWFFKKYPKVFLGIITAAVLATLGISYFNKRDNTDIRKNVDYINSVLHIPNSPTRSLNVHPLTDTIK